ncbi:hypothetical protein OESDEN_22677 [Oesophagostomum dentatum]|uniref:Uncharacterized protein n=1 Tax=Oesophagostomum dentatum TaxID=61180 RepID=A0A0B1RXB6_OESDE|nr:hypothetical protein OESDEN_22677 [Oesophagostomum dentatum]
MPAKNSTFKTFLDFYSFKILIISNLAAGHSERTSVPIRPPPYSERRRKGSPRRMNSEQYPPQEGQIPKDLQDIHDSPADR